MFKAFLKNLDPGSLVVVALTFVLFFTALFVQGFTHDVLLETAVFLVSLKLIIMAHKQAVHTKTMEQRLDQIHQAIRSANAAGSANSASTGTPRV